MNPVRIRQHVEMAPPGRLAAWLDARGRVERAPTPALGWHEIDSDDPSIVPAGPRLEWHYDRFDVPPGATEIARTEAAPQAFRLGPHLGVQFHPEATVEIVAVWARAHAEQAAAHGIDDATALLSASSEVREAARAAAFRLFDTFLAEASKTDHFRERAAV